MRLPSLHPMRFAAGARRGSRPRVALAPSLRARHEGSNDDASRRSCGTSRRSLAALYRALTSGPASETLPLGLHRGTYGSSQATLALGEGLVLLSVSEARHGTQLFREESVLGTVETVRSCHPQVIAEAVMAAALDFAASPKDDLEVLAVHRA